MCSYKKGDWHFNQECQCAESLCECLFPAFHIFLFKGSTLTQRGELHLLKTPVRVLPSVDSSDFPFA